MMQACLRKTCTDKCLTIIFSFGHGWARLPLAKNFRDNDKLSKMKITQLYGSEDFMDRKFADKLKEEGYMSKDTKIITISKSGHHLYTDNAPEVI